jgi:SAM-dependent methyltransferase
MNDEVAKAAAARFLAANPFPGKFTDGLYFRDKMRAIHRIAPDRIGRDLLEIGGGRSGLSKLLYPDAEVVNIDLDPALADAPCNRRPGQRFVAGSATELPFADASFDVVTMFDLIEHVEDDERVAAEAMRVLRPNGVVLLTTPSSERWRYPHYSFLRPLCRDEGELMEEWGHVRRGYRQERLDSLFGGPPAALGGFVNGALALSHDIAFSKLSPRARLAAHLLAAPISLYGWLTHGPGAKGTEIAAAWRKLA